MAIKLHKLKKPCPNCAKQADFEFAVYPTSLYIKVECLDCHYWRARVIPSQDPEAAFASLKPKKQVDPERMIKEYGAKKLSEDSEGRMYLAQAREKYKKDLLQPSDPEFKKVYGKQHKENQEAYRYNEGIAKKMWADRGKPR